MSCNTDRAVSTVAGIAVALSATLGLACARDAVVFATSTRFGIELNTTEAGQQGARIGYKRAEGVTMPVRYEPETESGDGESGDSAIREEAYPVFAAFRFDTGSILLAGLGSTQVEQRFATGDAAVAATSSSENLGSILEGGFQETFRSMCLAKWNAANAVNTAALGEWMEGEGLPREPTLLIYSDLFKDEARASAIEELQIDCEED